MAVQTLPHAPAVDVERFSLRRFLEDLRAAGLLLEHTQPIDLGDVAQVFETDQAVWLRAVGPERSEVAGNLAASRELLARAFGVPAAGLLAELQRRLQQPPDIVEVARDQAPAQQLVLTGDQVDLTRLPLHLQHELDGGLYISSAIDYAIDPASGWTNVGMRRLMLRSRTETGIDLVSPSDLQALYRAALNRGQRLPVSFTCGSHPIDMVAATMRLPVDELGIVASLRGAPLPVVRCVTNDLRVPADAEIVLEGYLDGGYSESEGPYGEFLGYYGAVKHNPVFHCTAITTRRQPIFQTVTIGGYHMSRTDSATLVSLRTEATVWQAIQAAVREPVAIYATTATGGMFNVRISLRQRVPGEARNAILAALGCLANIKNVFVVDPDIDIFSDEQLDWALATRFQPDRDLLVVGDTRTLPLDPSLPNGARTGSKAGFDLTWPLSGAGRIEREVPVPPSFSGKRFPSLSAALEDAPRYFGELLAALGTRDGREVVLELDALRQTGRLERDDRGRYSLKPAAAG